MPKDPFFIFWESAPSFCGSGDFTQWPPSPSHGSLLFNRGMGAPVECFHLKDRGGGVEACFAESHAAAVKHNVITIEKVIGRINRYLQLTTVMAAKQRANAHAVPRMSAKVAGGRPPSCHANIAANK